MYGARMFPWWTEKQKRLAEDLAQFVDEELFPLSREYERSLKFPWKIARKVADKGLFSIGFPEKYGGSGEDYGTVGKCIVNEELGRIGFGMITFYGTTVYGLGSPLTHFGSEYLKEKYLAKLTRGEILGAVCLTEPQSGSDAASMELSAHRDGDCYILNGKKRFISNAGVADLYTVYCRTDLSPEAKAKYKHLSGFIVEADTPGFTIEKVHELCGLDGVLNGVLNFDNVRVPKENLLAQEGEGWKVMTGALNAERVIGAAGQMGPTRTAIESTLEYTAHRIQFGRPINENQGLQFMIADMVTMWTMARTMIYSTAYLIDQGEDPVLEASVSKLYASECMMKVAHHAVQLHGGDGYTKYYPVERAFRDAKVREISAGSNQIQRLLIWRQALNRYRDLRQERKSMMPGKETKADLPRAILELLAEDYLAHPGLFTDKEDLKYRLGIEDEERLKTALLGLEKEGLVSLYRSRPETISLIKANHKGLSKAKPDDYYRMIPEWAQEDLQKRLKDIK